MSTVIGFDFGTKSIGVAVGQTITATASPLAAIKAKEGIPDWQLIEKLFAKRTRHSLGRIRSPRQDLKFEQLKIYYQESGKTLNQQFSANLGLRTEDKQYNYVGYLMADENAVSIKVAKYKGKNRVDLVENNEYGYCSLIKATNRVLDKIELENRTASRITSKKRIDTRLWNPVALREAIINSIVHTDFTREIPPKFEIFSDRIEITSAGGLPEDLSHEGFFAGFSVPRNQEIMRIFKDLELVEHLGSGVPRILESYDESCFHFSDNFLRMSFPIAEIEGEENGGQDGGQTGGQTGGSNRWSNRWSNSAFNRTTTRNF